MLDRAEIGKKADGLRAWQVLFPYIIMGLKDNVISQAAIFLPKWDGSACVADSVVAHNKSVWRAKKDATDEPSQKSSNWTKVVDYKEGTVDDPIPYGSLLFAIKDRYYSYNKKVYLCKGDMIPCTIAPDSKGAWQWAAVGAD